MKNLIIIILLVLQANASLAQDTDSIVAKWEFFVMLRMSKMEEIAHVRYIVNSEPKIIFGIPDYIQNEAGFGACYDLRDGSIWVTPAYKNEALPPGYDSSGHFITRLIDHELAHMYVSQMSMRLFGKIWPDTVLLTPSQNFTRNMLAEGVANYYENLVHKDSVNFIEWIPKSADDIAWLDSKSIIYQGGYYLVKPILDKYGQRGLVYILQNGFDYEDGDLRSAVLKYQSDAIKKLK